MLNSSSPAQKNLSDEDSSGSEPETDRFGFLLTNGSTAGSVGPSPELVRQREAKWIKITDQWDRILSKKSSKVKVQCQKGIPASLRARCWPLLCGAASRMEQHQKLYETLDKQPALQSWVDIIERDLDRQFPFHEMFQSKDGHGQRGLFRVLKAYTQYQPEEGYCQAQGPVAAVLLMNMPAQEAFWCLVQISEQYLPGYYSPLLEGVLFDAAMVTWVLKKTCPAAHKHLQHHGVEPLMFATDWLMCLFTRHLPFNTLLRVWDLFFCYGVRVLLQVSAVLVRRVLGRAEQRKQCQGQMETLEKLRGVKDQVQEEDDEFIAEVCSVPLSGKDLEKQTEKQLEKWRKDRPSSTFDPRGRCHGYRMAWARAKQNEIERERIEREKGNLSVPLTRSASTLSLSPSVFHKRWKKGGKGSTSDSEGGNKVVRHRSMGAREDWKSCNEFDFKKVQGVKEEEDVFSEEDKEGQTEQKELSQTPEKVEQTKTIPTEVTVAVKEQTENVEARITEKEESKLSENEESKNSETEVSNVRETEDSKNSETEDSKNSETEDSKHSETEESKMLSEPKQETNKTPNQTVENILHPTDYTPHFEVEEKLDTESESQVLEEQSHKSKEQEVELKDTNEETEKHVAAVEENHSEILREGEADTNTVEEMQISVHSGEEQMTQADMKSEESAETDNVQQVKMDTEVPESKSETSVETDRGVEALTVEDENATTETETQQEKEELITETEEGAIEVKCHSTESLVEIEKEAESHTQTDIETEALKQTRENPATPEDLKSEIIETDSEQHVDSKTEIETEEETLILSSSECTQQEEGTGAVDNIETEVEITVEKDTMEGSNEAAEGIILNVHSEAQVESDSTVCAQEIREETPTETETDEKAAGSVTATETEETSAPADELNHTTENDEERVIQTGSSETEAPEESTSQVTVGPEDLKQNIQQMDPVAEEEMTAKVRENRAGEDDGFISSEPTNDPQIQCSQSVKEAPVQTSEPHSSRSSGDFRVRKSSTSRSSRLARRLSEDLFTTPQKTSENHPEAKHTEPQCNPGAVIQKQSAPDVMLSAEVTEDATAQQQSQPDPPKRFGLFRRLRGEQHKDTKAKKAPKMQVPKILIQDFSDMTGTGTPVEEEVEEKLTSRERRRRRRERERREKEEERLKKKREKELEKERERKKPQTRGKSFQVQKEKGSDDIAHPAKTGSKTLRYSASYAESYF